MSRKAQMLTSVVRPSPYRGRDSLPWDAQALGSAPPRKMAPRVPHHPSSVLPALSGLVPPLAAPPSGSSPSDFPAQSPQLLLLSRFPEGPAGAKLSGKVPCGFLPQVGHFENKALHELEVGACTLLCLPLRVRGAWSQTGVQTI